MHTDVMPRYDVLCRISFELLFLPIADAVISDMLHTLETFAAADGRYSAMALACCRPVPCTRLHTASWLQCSLQSAVVANGDKAVFRLCVTLECFARCMHPVLLLSQA